MRRTLFLLALVGTSLISGCVKPPELLQISNLSCFTKPDFQRARFDPAYKQTEFTYTTITDREGYTGLYYCFINTKDVNSNQTTKSPGREME
jgi:hypothetical protein